MATSFAFLLPISIAIVGLVFSIALGARYLSFIFGDWHFRRFKRYPAHLMYQVFYLIDAIVIIPIILLLLIVLCFQFRVLF